MSDQYGSHSSGSSRMFDGRSLLVYVDDKWGPAQRPDAMLYTQAQVDALVAAVKEQAAAVLEDMAFHSAANEVGCFDDGEGAAPALRRAAARIRDGK